MGSPAWKTKALKSGLSNEGRLVLAVLLIQVLLIVPGGFTEVVSFPRFLVIFVLGSILLPRLLPQIRVSARGGKDAITILILTLISILWLIVFFSGADISDQIIGERGRNTGALTYTCLALVALYLYYERNENLSKALIRAFPILSLVIFAYVILQKLNLDPLPWNNNQGWIVGTFGNPNFLSSYFGIAFVLTLGQLFLSSKRSEKLLCSAVLVMQILGIYFSVSKQGFVIALAGSVMLAYFFVLWRKRVLELVISTAVMILAGVLGLLGTLNRGPFSTLIYEESITYRGDYWRAGIAMGLDNPLLGLGIDQYGSNYRSYRDQSAGYRREGDVTSDSAHNVFIDFFSGGGLPLILAYSALIIWVVFIGIKRIMTSLEFDLMKGVITSAFVAYLIQSIISINQLTLAFIGWILIGTILSWREPLKAVPIKNVSLVSRVVSIMAILAFLIPLVNYTKIDVRFTSMVKSGNIEGVIKLVSNPNVDNYYRNVTIASINGEEAGPIKESLLKISLDVNPKDFISLKLLRTYSLEKGDVRTAESTRQRMLEIDPFNKSIQKPSQ